MLHGGFLKCWYHQIIYFIGCSIINKYKPCSPRSLQTLQGTSVAAAPLPAAPEFHDQDLAGLRSMGDVMGDGENYGLFSCFNPCTYVYIYI